MRKFFATFALISMLATAGGAAPVTRNLGQNLTYHRVHQLPADLPGSDDTRRQACVLDLRYVKGGAEEAAGLAGWLKFNATARAPVFVLANSETSSALLSMIAPRGPGASIVVLGAGSETFTPDIALKISAAADRRAYDEFEHGVLTDSLITENPDKPRNDEAKLAKDRQGDTSVGSVNQDSLAEPTPPTPSTDAPSDKPKPPPPVVDAVLQRAVQLHRALLALKKI